MKMLCGGTNFLIVKNTHAFDKTLSNVFFFLKITLSAIIFKSFSKFPAICACSLQNFISSSRVLILEQQRLRSLAMHSISVFVRGSIDKTSKPFTVNHLYNEISNSLRRNYAPYRCSFSLTTTTIRLRSSVESCRAESCPTTYLPLS